MHLTDDALRTNQGVARVEGIGPVTTDQIRDWLRAPDTAVVVKPVIDLNDQAPVDGYEIPDRLREAVHLITPTDVFPHATNKTRRMDLDHTVPYRHRGPPGQTAIGNLAPMTTVPPPDQNPRTAGNSPNPSPASTSGKHPTADTSSSTTPAPPSSAPPNHPAPTPTSQPPAQGGHRHARTRLSPHHHRRHHDAATGSGGAVWSVPPPGAAAELRPRSIGDLVPRNWPDARRSPHARDDRPRLLDVTVQDVIAVPPTTVVPERPVLLIQPAAGEVPLGHDVIVLEVRQHRCQAGGWVTLDGKQEVRFITRVHRPHPDARDQQSRENGSHRDEHSTTRQDRPGLDEGRGDFGDDLTGRQSRRHGTAPQA